MANRAYRYRLYPDKEQAEQIIKTVGCCRYIYNTFLDRAAAVSAENWYRSRKSCPG